MVPYEYHTVFYTKACTVSQIDRFVADRVGLETILLSMSLTVIRAAVEAYGRFE